MGYPVYGGVGDLSDLGRDTPEQIAARAAAARVHQAVVVELAQRLKGLSLEEVFALLVPVSIRDTALLDESIVHSLVARFTGISNNVVDILMGKGSSFPPNAYVVEVLRRTAGVSHSDPKYDNRYDADRPIVGACRALREAIRMADSQNRLGGVHLSLVPAEA